MFIVLDCSKPADCNGFKQLKGYGWDKSSYDTFEAAEDYALKWLGIYGPGKGVLKLNEPYDYCMGSEIEIREVE